MKVFGFIVFSDIGDGDAFMFNEINNQRRYIVMNDVISGSILSSVTLIRAVNSNRRKISVTKDT